MNSPDNINPEMPTSPTLNPVLLLLLLAVLPVLLLGAYILRDISAARRFGQAGSLERTLDLAPALRLREQSVTRSPGNPDRHLELARAAQTLWYLRHQPRYRQLADTEYRC